MDIQYNKAAPEDYGEVIDLANYVFSFSHGPHDFPALLPKLYRREYFMDGIHYLARENNRIKAIVGAYPLAFEFPGLTLPGRGIGMVSVHPYCRSRGYMKTLMNMALEDMKRDGMIFSCLGGQRQRYEYFGYTPAGAAYSFTCSWANIIHTLGRDWKSDLALKVVEPGDAALLDGIQALHESKRARVRRRRDRLFDTLSSWKARVFAVIQGERFQGYFLYTDRNRCISEIDLYEPSRLPEVIGLLLRDQREAGRGDEAEVLAGPQEQEKLAALSRFAEDCRQGPAYQFAVFGCRAFLEPFLALKSQERVLADGEFVIQIEEDPPLCLAVSGGAASVSETSAAPQLRLDRLEALRFLFSPEAVFAFAAVQGSPFLQSLLPLPLFFERCGEV
jgi:predicted N-acetyltransferase YhbS